MKEGQKKRTLKEEWKILMRGIRTAFEINPQYLIHNIFFQIGQILSPYFSLYMSAQFINELSGQCRSRRLAVLAGITVSGLFAISVIKRMLQARRNTWAELLSSQQEIYMFDRQNGLQYEHLENPEVSLMREQIYAAMHASNTGLLAIFDDIGSLFGDGMDLIASVSLTFSIFRTAPNASLSGFLAFVNSPYCACLLAAILMAHMALTVRFSKESMKKTMEAISGLASENVLYSVLFNMYGEDTSIFNLKKILIKAHRKRTRPAWLLEMEKANLRYDVIRTLQKVIPDMAVFLVTAAKAFLGVFGIGNFILYRGTVNRFVNAVVQVTNCLSHLRANNEYLLQLYRFLDLPDDMYYGSLAVEKRDDIEYEIEFRNVSFRYPNTDSWVLRDVNMKFRIGDKLAIVGENGSGKTTFIKLLCRLYDPTEGTILLNGIDITRYR